MTTTRPPAAHGRRPLPLLTSPPPPAPPPSMAAELRVMRTRLGASLFVADGSRLYDVDDRTAGDLERWLDAGGPSEHETARVRSALRLLPHAGGRRIGETPPAPPPLSSISLNVAQACNLSCRYCYADEGRFGGSLRLMPVEVARAAVDQLLRESEAGSRVLLGFMGGEPLLNRAVVHDATRYAAAAAARLGRMVGFSITTNATLLTPEDAALFAEFGFVVQVSMDGPPEDHDRLRPQRDGRGSYERVLAGVQLLLGTTRPRVLSARATVTPHSGNLLLALDHLVGLGFDDVGFAPVLVSPDPEQAFAASDFPKLLAQMVECGRKAAAEWLCGRPYPFGNLATALDEIHRGTHRPYPCGAGAGYLSSNASGELFACHRLIDDPQFAMGDVNAGTDTAARAAHLARRHVDANPTCRACWARYLCGGGCYHEVERRGRPGCDYVRGWLQFCLATYLELAAAGATPLTWSPAGIGRDGAGDVTDP